MFLLKKLKLLAFTFINLKTSITKIFFFIVTQPF